MLDNFNVFAFFEDLLPKIRSLLVRVSVLIELAFLNESLLLLGVRTESPLLRVLVSIHDNSLDLGDTSVIASRDESGGHLGDTDGDGLSLSGHDDNFLSDLDTVLVSEDSGDHELSSVADGVDSGVLDDDSGVSLEEDLKRHDHLSKVRFILEVLIKPLGILDVVHGDHGLVLLHGSGSDSSELLHMGTNIQVVTEVNTLSSDISSGFARNVEDSHVLLSVEIEKFGPVDSSNSQSLGDSGDKRGSLEDGTLQLGESSLELGLSFDGSVKLEDSNVLFSSRLLGLHESSGSIQADDEASSNLRVESSRMSSLLGLQDLLDPSDNLMGRGVGRLVEVDNTILLEDLNRSGSRRISFGDRGEMTSLDIELIVVLQKKRPLGSVLG